jgi:lambda repressor-like predicted transcriptional regulator
MLLSIPFGVIFVKFSKNISSIPIDNSTQCMLLYSKLEELTQVQALIAQLEEKGWSLAAIADSDELKVHRNTVGMWKAGTRYPKVDKPVIDALNRLLKRNRIPKKKRYAKGGRGKNG